jgi:hypothetical protein
MVGYREHRSAELIAIDQLTQQVGELSAEQRVMLKTQDTIIRILAQIKEAVTPQDGAGDDAFGKLIGELLATSRAQVSGLARVEAALAKP